MYTYKTLWSARENRRWEGASIKQNGPAPRLICNNSHLLFLYNNSSLAFFVFLYCPCCIHIYTCVCARARVCVCVHKPWIFAVAGEPSNFPGAFRTDATRLYRAAADVICYRPSWRCIRPPYSFFIFYPFFIFAFYYYARWFYVEKNTPYACTNRAPLEFIHMNVYAASYTMNTSFFRTTSPMR